MIITKNNVAVYPHTEADIPECEFRGRENELMDPPCQKPTDRG